MATEEQDRVARELYGTSHDYDKLSEWGKFAVDQELRVEQLDQERPLAGELTRSFNPQLAQHDAQANRLEELERTVARLQEENIDYVLEIEELKEEIERQRPQP